MPLIPGFSFGKKKLDGTVMEFPVAEGGSINKYDPLEFDYQVSANLTDTRIGDSFNSYCRSITRLPDNRLVVTGYDSTNRFYATVLTVNGANELTILSTTLLDDGRPDISDWGLLSDNRILFLFSSYDSSNELAGLIIKIGEDNQITTGSIVLLGSIGKFASKPVQISENRLVFSHLILSSANYISLCSLDNLAFSIITTFRVESNKYLIASRGSCDNGPEIFIMQNGAFLVMCRETTAVGGTTRTVRAAVVSLSNDTFTLIKPAAYLYGGEYAHNGIVFAASNGIIIIPQGTGTSFSYAFATYEERDGFIYQNSLHGDFDTSRKYGTSNDLTSALLPGNAAVSFHCEGSTKSNVRVYSTVCHLCSTNNGFYSGDQSVLINEKNSCTDQKCITFPNGKAALLHYNDTPSNGQYLMVFDTTLVKRSVSTMHGIALEKGLPGKKIKVFIPKYKRRAESVSDT